MFSLQRYRVALPSTHYYWHISKIIIALKGELLLSKCSCILAGSYPLSHPFPFDDNYTCKRFKSGEHRMGPMQRSLTTEALFKSQKILFKASALSSNLIQGRLSTSQLPILDPPSPVTWLTSFLSCPPTPYGLPPSFARFCDTRISSFFFNAICGLLTKRAKMNTHQALAIFRVTFLWMPITGTRYARREVWTRVQARISTGTLLQNEHTRD